MGGKWRRAPLGDLIEFTRDGEWGSDQPGANSLEMLVVRGTDFARLRLGALADIPRRYIERGAAERKQLRAGDVLIETAGGTKDQSTGRTALVKQSHIDRAGLPVTCASFARFLRFNRAKVDPEFMYWWLQSLYASGEMERHQVQHTGIARFQFTKFVEGTEAPLPPLPEQRAIAHILGTLDGKIELNRRMNETLEAMARALFRSWFVDFDPVRTKAEGRDPELPGPLAALFPDSFEESELGEIPRGWRVEPFLDTVGVTSGGTPRTSVPGYWNGEIPWFSVVDSPGNADVWVIDTEKKVTRAGVENSSTQILPKGTTIITARGTVGRVALVGIPMAMNQSCYGLRGRTDEHGYYTYYVTRQLVSTLQQRVHGSVFDTVTRDTLAGVKIVVPPFPVIEAFEDVAGPTLTRIRINRFESRILAALRDTLLPKLISGHLRVQFAKPLLEMAQ